MVLAEVGEIVWGEIVFGGNLIDGKVGGLEVHQHVDLAFVVEPFANGHTEGFLELAVECGGRHVHERAKLLGVQLACVVTEHLFAEVEVVALHPTGHIEQLLLII